MRVTVVVPIKLNNERLPGKNLKILGDKPLIQYILHTLKSIPIIDTVYVYCSDERICDFLPAEVRFLKRPEFLDLPSCRINQVIDCFVADVKSDIYVLAHATSPYLRAETVSACIEAVRTEAYDSSFTVTKIQDFLWMQGKALNFDPSDIPRTQDMSPVYRETSGVYVFSDASYRNYHARVGKHPYLREVSFKEAIDINDSEDFKLAENVLNM
jgi:CMP-N-acetylneuraminic acid synthetase